PAWGALCRKRQALPLQTAISCLNASPVHSDVRGVTGSKAGRPVRVPPMGGQAPGLGGSAASPRSSKLQRKLTPRAQGPLVVDAPGAQRRQELGREIMAPIRSIRGNAIVPRSRAASGLIRIAGRRA